MSEGKGSYTISTEGNARDMAICRQICKVQIDAVFDKVAQLGGMVKGIKMMGGVGEDGDYPISTRVFIAYPDE